MQAIRFGGERAWEGGWEGGGGGGGVTWCGVEEGARQGEGSDRRRQ